MARQKSTEGPRPKCPLDKVGIAIIITTDFGFDTSLQIRKGRDFFTASQSSLTPCPLKCSLENCPSISDE